MLTASSCTTAEARRASASITCSSPTFLISNRRRVNPSLRDLDPVVAFAVDVDDLESAVLVGLGRFGDLAQVGRRGDARPGDGKRVGAGDSAANDVGRLLGQRGERQEDTPGGREEGEAADFHGGTYEPGWKKLPDIRAGRVKSMRRGPPAARR